MKTLILCGGYGSRLGSISENKPKPMVEIGNKPMLWHIMKLYDSYNYRDFVLLTGYKSNVIKEYFMNFNIYNNNFKVNLKKRSIDFLEDNNQIPDWEVTLLDTGVDTLKGGRIKKAQKYVEDENFFLTYGDGISDINIKELLEFHKSHGKIITVSGVKPPSRFGELIVQGNKVESFEEKPQVSNGLINGGFMVCNKKLFEYLNDSVDCDFEFGVMEKLAKEGEVMVYKHNEFWECVDNERDLIYLNRLWSESNAPWKKW